MALTPLTAWARGQSTSERRFQKDAWVDTECLKLPIRFPKSSPEESCCLSCLLSEGSQTCLASLGRVQRGTPCLHTATTCARWWWWGSDNNDAEEPGSLLCVGCWTACLEKPQMREKPCRFALSGDFCRSLQPCYAMLCYAMLSHFSRVRLCVAL